MASIEPTTLNAPQAKVATESIPYNCHHQDFTKPPRTKRSAKSFVDLLNGLDCATVWSVGNHPNTPSVIGKFRLVVELLESIKLDDVKLVKEFPDAFYGCVFESTHWRESNTWKGLNLENPFGALLSLTNGGRADYIHQSSAGRGHGTADFKFGNYLTGRVVWLDAKNFISEKIGPIAVSCVEEYLVPRFVGAPTNARKIALVSPRFSENLTPEARERLEKDGVELVALPSSVSHPILNDPKAQEELLDSLTDVIDNLLDWVATPFVTELVGVCKVDDGERYSPYPNNTEDNTPYSSPLILCRASSDGLGGTFADIRIGSEVVQDARGGLAARGYAGRLSSLLENLLEGGAARDSVIQQGSADWTKMGGWEA